jgi:hypothetical protein
MKQEQNAVIHGHTVGRSLRQKVVASGNQAVAQYVKSQQDRTTFSGAVQHLIQKPHQFHKILSFFPIFYI